MPLVTRTRIQNDMVVELQQFALGVVDPVDGFDRDALPVLELHVGADVLQLQNFELSDVLGSSAGGNFVGPRVGGKAVKPRQFHDNLGAGQRDLAGINREGRNQAERVEECGDYDEGFDIEFAEGDG